ncbi:MAG: SGNH/GDSL hydrolase family protein [Hyphomicrobiales bacterium]|nr:SGNH/GDSL hydrolase family protein [Hyphomicrobiales bacterium]
MTLLKKLIGATLWLAKWSLLAVLAIEVISFSVVTATNFIIYGHAREGSRAVYDPYSLFLQKPAVRQTRNNRKGAERRIWLFGGSTMRGATRDDAATIPSIVAAIVNAPETGLRYKVINFGTNSFNSLLETKYLQKLLIETKTVPDVIVFYDGANDTKYFLEHRSIYGHHGFRRVQALIESYYRSWFGLLKPLNAAFYASFTRELYGRINQVLVPLEQGSPLLDDLADATRARYRFVARLSAAFDAEFLLVWQPMAWTEGCAVAPEVATAEASPWIAGDRLKTVRDNFSVTYGTMAESLSSEPYFVSFARALCGRNVPMYAADGVHLTDAGRRLIGERIGQMLVERLSRR